MLQLCAGFAVMVAGVVFRLCHEAQVVWTPFQVGVINGNSYLIGHRAQ
jgi:hypothetical protein